jgi:hypothetical protein
MVVAINWRTVESSGSADIEHSSLSSREVHCRLLHDRSLSSAARDESCMASDESCMARDKPRMTGDYCRPEASIHRCVRTYSHLYSYIYDLVALLDYIQSGFPSITI